MSSQNTFLFCTGRENSDGRSMCAWSESNNPTCDELLASVSRKPIYIGFEHHSTMLFRGESIAILLPPKSRPMSIFPQLKFQMQNQKAPGNCPFLALVAKKSNWINNVTLTFQDINHFYPPFDMHFSSKKELSDTVKGVIYDALDGATWESVMNDAIKSIGLKISNIIFFWNNGKTNTVLFPKMKPLDFVKANFNSDYSLFKPKGVLYYELQLQNDSIERNFAISALLPRLEINEMHSFIENIIVIIKMKLGNDISNKEKRCELEKVLSRVVILNLLSQVSRLGKPDFSISKWNDYVNMFIALAANPEYSESLKDQKQSNLSMFSFISRTENLIERIIELTSLFTEALKESNMFMNNTIYGRVLYSCFLDIEDTSYTLLLTSGFLEIMNFSPIVVGAHEILPLNYQYKCSNASPLLFATPIQCLEVCPMTRTKSIIVSNNGSFVVDFPTERALVDFIIAVNIMKVMLKDKTIVPTLLKSGTTEVTINSSFSDQGMTTVVNTKILGKTWNKQFQTKLFVNALDDVVLSNPSYKNKMAIPTGSKLEVPKHIIVSHSTDVLGITIKTENLTNELLPMIPATNSASLLFEKALLLDAITTQSLDIAYGSLKAVSVVSYTKAIDLHDADIIRLYATSFPEKFKEEMLFNQSLLNFSSRYLSDLQIIIELTNHVDPNQHDPNTKETNILASLRNNGSETEVLIAAGANFVSSDGATVHPLILAIENGRNDKLIDLLKKGSCANCNSSIVCSALVYCIVKNNIEALKTIIPFLGKSVNIAAKNGAFPLHTCLICKNYTAAQLLIRASHDLNPNMFTNEYPQIIHFCITEKSEEMLKIVLEHPAIDINILNSEGKTPLSKSIELNQLNLTKILLSDLRCDPNFPDLNGMMPIHVAATSENSDAIKLLVEAGSMIDMPTPEGETAILIASRKNNIVLSKLLLSLGSNQRMWYFKGNLPEHIATTNEMASVLRSSTSTPVYQIHDDFTIQNIVFNS